MKKPLVILLIICLSTKGLGQQIAGASKDSLLKELSESSCKCIDSITVYDKSRSEVSKEINKCIDNLTGAYQLGSKLLQIDSLKKTATEKDGKKEITISLNMDKSSPEYKKLYYEIERYLMNNCSSIKEKIAANDKQSEGSFSNNKEALDLYSKGLDESKKDNCKAAINYFKQAVEIDPRFAFAWDNMGLCYRKSGDYNEAIKAYQKSLEIDPGGLLPLQNIAVAYQYKKEYNQAIKAFLKLAEIDKNNPEVYYGIGNIYTTYLNDYEKGLENMCKAYNLYADQKSAYRADAEKIIQLIYSQMKKQGKEAKFSEILKANHISSE